MRFIALHDPGRRRFYVDHSCRVETTSDPLEATNFTTIKLARQYQESIFEDWGRRFEIVNVQFDYTYHVLREAP